MEFKAYNFTIICSDRKVEITGAWDFYDCSEIEDFLKKLKSDEEGNTEPVIIDVKSLEYANSTAIRILSNFILRLQKKVTMIINQDKTWQKMALEMLAEVNPGQIKIEY